MTRTDEVLTARSPTRRPRVFYGWWIVLVAVLLSAYQGGVLFYGFTLLVTPMTEETGWSYTAVTAVFPILGILVAVILPILGILFDRVGPRPILGAAHLLMGLGMVLMGLAHSIPAFYVAFAIANLGAAGTWASAGPAVANWFVRHRGRAMGAYSLGYAIAGAMTLPFLWLIESFGWRGALGIAGVFTWLLIIPAVWVIRHRPEQYGLWPDGADGPPDYSALAGAEINLSPRQALSTRAFWLLALASLMAFMTIGALQVHWAPFLESVGFSRHAAAFFLPALPLSTVVGRVGFGVLTDLWDKRRVTALAFALQGVAVVSLALIDVSRAWLVPVFLVLWGFGFGGTVVTRPILQGDLFGRFSFGTVQGLLSMTGEAGFAVTPLIASLGFENLGTYRPVFLAFAGLAFLAAPVVLAIRRPSGAGRRL